MCEELTHQADALTDLQLINDLHILRFRHQNTLSQKLLTSEADIVQLWQNAAKVQKSKTAVLLHWYGVAVSCDHWEDAQLVRYFCICSTVLMVIGYGWFAKRRSARAKLFILLYSSKSYALGPSKF